MLPFNRIISWRNDKTPHSNRHLDCWRWIIQGKFASKWLSQRSAKRSRMLSRKRLFRCLRRYRDRDDSKAENHKEFAKNTFGETFSCAFVELGLRACFVADDFFMVSSSGVDLTLLVIA